MVLPTTPNIPLGQELGSLRRILRETRGITESTRQGLANYLAGDLQDELAATVQALLRDLGQLDEISFTIENGLTHLSSAIAKDLHTAQISLDFKYLVAAYRDGKKTWENLGDGLIKVAVGLQRELRDQDPVANMGRDWGSTSDAVLALEFLDETNEDDRLVLDLRYHCGLSQNEIGELLGITQSAAANRILRALDRLALLVGAAKLRRIAQDDGYEVLEVPSLPQPFTLNSGRRVAQTSSGRLRFRKVHARQSDSEHSDEIHLDLHLLIASTGDGDGLSGGDFEKIYQYANRSTVPRTGNRPVTSPGGNTNLDQVLAIYKRKKTNIHIIRLNQFLGLANELLSNQAPIDDDVTGEWFRNTLTEAAVNEFSSLTQSD